MQEQLKPVADAGSNSATSTPFDDSDGVHTAPTSTSTAPPNASNALHSTGDTAEDAQTADYSNLHFGVDLELMTESASCWTTSKPVDTSYGVDSDPKSASTHPPKTTNTLLSAGESAEDAHKAAYGDLHFGVELKLVASTASC